eukprot:3720216-Pyramimonas_sp.AAC.1
MEEQKIAMAHKKMPVGEGGRVVEPGGVDDFFGDDDGDLARSQERELHWAVFGAAGPGAPGLGA